APTTVFLHVVGFLDPGRPLWTTQRGIRRQWATRRPGNASPNVINIRVARLTGPSRARSWTFPGNREKRHYHCIFPTIAANANNLRLQPPLLTVAGAACPRVTWAARRAPCRSPRLPGRRAGRPRPSRPRAGRSLLLR